MFFLIMADVWNKYTSQLTSIGIRQKSSSKEKQTLPCFIIRPLAAYKSRGFFFTDKDFEEKTFKLEDIFWESTITKLKNDSLYVLKELKTLAFGKCFLLCYKVEVKPQFSEPFELKSDKDYIVYILDAGEEFWLTMPYRFPYEISFSNLQSRNEDGITKADLTIREVEIEERSNEFKPCQSYNQYQSDNEGFIDCSKKSFWSVLKGRINCTIPGLDMLVDSSSNFMKCKENSEAFATLTLLSDTARRFQKDPSQMGCPLPCKRRKYLMHFQYYHSTSVMGKLFRENEFTLYYFYESFIVEERKESLVYDFSTFLVAIGGNLGLCLGFSCLSVGIAILDFFKNQMIV